MDEQLELAIPLTLSESVERSLDWVGQALTIFTTEPAIYFVAFAVVGAAAGVARKFVPMKKR